MRGAEDGGYENRKRTTTEKLSRLNSKHSILRDDLLQSKAGGTGVRILRRSLPFSQLLLSCLSEFRKHWLASKEGRGQEKSEVREENYSV